MYEDYRPPTLADKDPDRVKEAVRVTVVGAVANVALSIGKFVAGILGNSTALVADAVHSLSDLITDAVTVVSVRISATSADDEHPYGHGRAEAIGAGVTGAALALAGAFMIFEIAGTIFEAQTVGPTWLAIAGAILSIVIKEWLYQYTFRIGKAQNNRSLQANAWHHRSDAISSVAALLGIIGAMAGFPSLDKVAAIFVGLMIIKAGWDISSEAVHELMDTAAPKETLDNIRAIIADTPGVRRYHELRTRTVGGDVFVDAHILVQPNISVSEAHNIAEMVRSNLKEKALITDALVHIDAEDDIFYKTLEVDRDAIEELVKKEAEKIEGINSADELVLHMLNGALCLEFCVEMDDNISVQHAKLQANILQDRIMELSEAKTVVIRGLFTKGIMETGFADRPGPN